MLVRAARCDRVLTGKRQVAAPQGTAGVDSWDLVVPAAEVALASLQWPEVDVFELMVVD